MKNAIKKFAKSKGIEYLGVVSAEPMLKLKEYLTNKRSLCGASDFEEPDIEKRINPKLLMEDAKSLIVCLFPYHTGNEKCENVSKYAQIPDYHKVCKKLLGEICDFLKENKENTKTLCFSDNGPLHDKYLAYSAGLGFFGKNTLLINEKYGSFVFIGYIVTNLELESDKPLDKFCLSCGKCIDACPGKALGTDGFNEKKCVSYITQIKDADEKQKEILYSQTSVYGCDVCQNVCPHNKDIPKTPIKEFYEKRLETLRKEEIEAMSNKKFKESFSDFAFSWRGKKAILKNFSDKA